MTKGRALRVGAIAFLIGGLVLMTVLVAHFGAGDVGRAIAAAGWTGVAAISGVHVLVESITGLAWWVLVRNWRSSAAPWTFIWGRILRDAGSDILPLSQVGGAVLGVRAVMLRGVSATLGAASTIVDVTLELAAQIIFTTVGIALLFALRPGSELAVPALIGVAVSILLAVGFFVAQRRELGLFEAANGWLATIAAGTEAVQREIRAIYRDRANVVAGFALHVAGWFASTLEIWVVLKLMGVPLSLGAVVVIESLLYAVRSVAFFVPNALGVQEGAYVVLGGLFGLSPDLALALSLLKRARDLVVGVPALLLWQFVESRRLLKRRGAAALALPEQGSAPP